MSYSLGNMRSLLVLSLVFWAALSGAKGYTHETTLAARDMAHRHLGSDFYRHDNDHNSFFSPSQLGRMEQKEKSNRAMRPQDRNQQYQLPFLDIGSSKLSAKKTKEQNHALQTRSFGAGGMPFTKMAITSPEEWETKQARTRARNKAAQDHAAQVASQQLNSQLSSQKSSEWQIGAMRQPGGGLSKKSSSGSPTKTSGMPWPGLNIWPFSKQPQRSKSQSSQKTSRPQSPKTPIQDSKTLKRTQSQNSNDQPSPKSNRRSLERSSSQKTQYFDAQPPMSQLSLPRSSKGGKARSARDKIFSCFGKGCQKPGVRHD